MEEGRVGAPLQSSEDAVKAQRMFFDSAKIQKEIGRGMKYGLTESFFSYKYKDKIYLLNKSILHDQTKRMKSKSEKECALKLLIFIGGHHHGV